MKILIAPGSFKGSIVSKEISHIIARGIKKIKKNVAVNELPIADGGLGTLNIITEYFKGNYVSCDVTGPLGKKIRARYGIIQRKNTGIIELAQASGLHLIPEYLRNPLETTTTGVGELIKDSIRKGCKRIIIGVGDSGTIDCGIGTLSALGVKFLDRNSKQIKTSCSGLLDLYKIDCTGIESLKSIEFNILVDVSNPLTGKNGAIVYASQKGATKKELPMIQQGLRNFKKVILNEYGIDLDKIKGSGAAGGIAGGMYAILNAKIIYGFDYFEKIFKLNKKIKNADLVITGEGMVDRTTFSGKATGRIIEICQKYDKPVILICGDYDQGLNFKKYGSIKIYSLVKIAKNKKSAILYPERFLKKLVLETAHFLESF
uniref:Glycerate kinase n=1 Tax=candidate division WOR-3 bacterium TaxID=2052148 RepID=A0A7V1EIL8_UNCW3